MFFLMIDELSGAIIGCDNTDRLLGTFGWVTCTEEAYEKAVINVVDSMVQPELLKERRTQYEKELTAFNKLKQEPGNDDIKFQFIAINPDDIISFKEKNQNIYGVAKNQVIKNYTYCHDYIEKGVRLTLSDGNIHDFSYKIEDQINLEQLSRLVRIGAIPKDNIPIKASGEEYMFVSEKDFNLIYVSLVKHKYKELFHMFAANKYVMDMEEILDIRRFTYEAPLPSEYQNVIEHHMEALENLNVMLGDK